MSTAMEIDSPPAPQTQPYTFDLGNLLCNDPNPLPPNPASLEESISSTARSAAQALIAQLLTTCPITRSADDGALQLTLPAPETPLPREKPVPKEKEKSKWDKFAEKKGIAKKRKDGKLVFDEGRGEWVAKYGYKGKKGGEGGGVQDDWIVEVDEKEERREKNGAAAAEGGGGKKGGLRKSTGEGDIARRDRKSKMRKGK